MLSARHPLKNTFCILLSACVNLELNPFLNLSLGTENLSLCSCSVAQLCCDCRWVLNLCASHGVQTSQFCSFAMQRSWRNWRAPGAVRSNLKYFSKVVSRSFSWDSSEGLFYSASTIMYWWRLMCISAQTSKQRNLVFNTFPYFFCRNKQINKMLYFSDFIFIIFKIIFIIFIFIQKNSSILKHVISKQNVDNF